MDRLVAEVNETVVLSVWEDSPIVVRVADGTDRLVRVSVRAGARLESGSAQHKVFAALLPAHEVPELHDHTGRSRVLHDEIDAVRASGIAFGDPGRHGVRTVAAPVFGDGRLVAVLALVGTTASLADDISSPAAKALRDAAATLTAQLGDSGPDDHRT
jgi:DNA-binding IclR family transcriptional regulator